MAENVIPDGFVLEQSLPDGFVLESEAPELEPIDFGEPVAEDGQFQVGGDVAISDIFEGIVPRMISAGERTLSMGTGMLAEPVSGLMGMADTMRVDTSQEGNLLRPTTALERADTVEQVRDTLTYQPRTEQAQVDQQAFAELMQPVVEYIDKARLGDEVLEAGYPPAVAAAYEAFPEAVMGLLTAAGLPSIRGATSSAPLRIKPKDAQQISDIMRGKRPAAQFKTTESKLSPGQMTVGKNKLGRDAISRGWDELPVSKVASLSSSEKPIYRRMLNKAKDYFDEFSPSGRPSDVVGAEVAKRLKYLHKLKKQNGQRLERIMEGPFARQQIDIDDFVGEFLQDMSDLGGRIDRSGKLVFPTESKMFQMPGNQKALSGLFDKIKISGNPTAKQVHELKGWIDEFIDYGKLVTKTESTVSKRVERLLKNYRSNLNSKLRVNDKYARANDIFSDATGALTDMQKAMGPSVDILDDAAVPLLGQKMRTFLSNNANRVKTEIAVGEAQAMANKWGGKFPNHDIAAQMKFINEMERLWGPFTDTAFKSEIGQSVQRVVEAPNLAQIGREGVRMTSKELKKFRQSQNKQIKSLENLLR